MSFIRWGGKRYYQQKPKPYKPDINDLMKPLGEKAFKGNVWGSVIMNVEKEEVVPVSPTPTPTNTPTNTPTPTPSITPTLTSSPTPTPSAVPSPTIDFRTSSRNNTNLTTYSFNSQDIGGDGLIVLSISYLVNSDSTGNLTSVTFDGNSMTQAVEQNFRAPTESVGYGSALYYYNYTGASTTADFSITYSFTLRNCSIGIYRLENITSTTPETTQTNTERGITDTTFDITLTGMSVNSAAIITGSIGNNSGGTTWSNATEDFDLFAENQIATSAQDIVSSTSTTYTTTFASTNRGRVLVGASWS
jgi:hypothetical protein